MQFGGDLLIHSFEVFGTLRFEHYRAGLIGERFELFARGDVCIVTAAAAPADGLVFGIQVDRVDRCVGLFHSLEQFTEAVFGREILIVRMIERIIHAVG